MIKRFYIRKLILSFVVIFSILLLSLIPNQDKINIEEEIKYVDKNVELHNIFLLDSNGKLAKTKVVVTKKEKKNIANELIQTLTLDSKLQDRIPSGFKAIIPENTQIKNISIKENVLKIDFNETLLDSRKEYEEKIIEAVCYTLTGIEGIDKVMIFINGEILSKLPQTNKILPSTLDRSLGINKEYNITNKDNITETTIYYISKFNDNTYYVPVTKVNNDNREKIEVIIDELSSKTSYTPTLMSYLSDNVKLVSTNNENDTLNLEFNEYIFNDIDEKDILEEVIYTICYSIEDNYNVNNIKMSVNGEEIYKSVLKTIE